MTETERLRIETASRLAAAMVPQSGLKNASNAYLFGNDMGTVAFVALALADEIMLQAATIGADVPMVDRMKFFDSGTGKLKIA